MGPENLYGVALIALPVLLSLTLHEYGHARVALAFGDDTALRQGRVTLNPLAHLDLLGTLCFLIGPFGWAKPVPVDASRLHPYRIGDIAVSLAGVGMNLLLIVFGTAALYVMSRLGVQADPEQVTRSGIGALMLAYLVLVNTSLLAFNLIPLYPLDGHHVLRDLLPHNKQAGFMEWQGRYGRWLLLGMMVVPWLGRRVFPQLAGASPAYNPVYWFLTVAYLVLRTLMPQSAARLADDALRTYGHLMPW